MINDQNTQAGWTATVLWIVYALPNHFHISAGRLTVTHPWSPLGVPGRVLRHAKSSVAVVPLDHAVASVGVAWTKEKR